MDSDAPSRAATGKGQRVLVCGGRDYDQWNTVRSVLEDVKSVGGIALVISGGASGADRLAERWAQHERIPLCVFPANWRFDGRKAGPLRNQAMLDFARPDLVVAFPGGRGTEDMVTRAMAARLPIREVLARDGSGTQKDNPQGES